MGGTDGSAAVGTGSKSHPAWVAAVRPPGSSQSPESTTEGIRDLV